jgi:hypothetical protein
MHTNALARNAKNYVLYYKDVLDILTHPLVEPYAQTSTLVNLINKTTTLLLPITLMELNPNPDLFLSAIPKWEKGSLVLETVPSYCLLLKIV